MFVTCCSHVHVLFNWTGYIRVLFMVRVCVYSISAFLLLPTISLGCCFFFGSVCDSLQNAFVSVAIAKNTYKQLEAITVSQKIQLT